jgi:hypothetical protein
VATDSCDAERYVCRTDTDADLWISVRGDVLLGGCERYKDGSVAILREIALWPGAAAKLCAAPRGPA